MIRADCMRLKRNHDSPPTLSIRIVSVECPHSLGRYTPDSEK
jgi:hypothetical protein